MRERDKFLTEAMGECWHEFYPQDDRCKHCEKYEPRRYKIHNDFSTWEGFGKLWEWAVVQEWFKEFLNIMDVGEYIENTNGDTFDIQKEFINPERFATAIYDYLTKEATKP